MIGENVEGSFLQDAPDFLNCNLGSVPFHYLGLPEGANPRRLSTWKMEVLRKRLSSWKNNFLSFGGRIVLLNSISVASLLQRKFLWGRNRDRKKIP